jgi:small subunit ribosomal protein S4e
MKRLAAPKSWMLDKLGGVFSVRPRSGPHKMQESMPITLFLRNRLKYALTAKEVETILKQRLVKIDGKLRTDPKFPAGFMDVIQIEKTGENFRLIYDVKGRFTIHRITNQEAKYKLCRVRKIETGPKNVPFLFTSDGRTIRYPDPIVKANDSIRLDITTGKIMDSIKFEAGNLCMVTGGRNTGRVGTIMHRERHPGSFDIVHVKDAQGHTFATRMAYIFVIGKGNKPYISLPKGAGIKMTVAEERDKRMTQRS